MPTFTIQTPEGKKLTIKADNEAAAIRGAQEWSKSNAPSQTGQGVDRLRDIAKAAKSGLLRGASGFAGAIGEARSIPAVGMLDQALKVADAIDLVRTGKRPEPNPPSIGAVQGVKSFLGGAPSAKDLAGMSERVNGKAYKPQTAAGRYAGSVAEMAPAALMPGSILSRVANTVLPGIGAQGAEDFARSLGANDQVAGYARLAGGIFGGVGANVRANPRPPAPPRDPAIERIIAGQNPQAMAFKLARYKSNNVEPALLDIVDDSARGTMRAGASRQTPARAKAVAFYDNRFANLPDKVRGHARRNLSQDPRTPDQIRAEMAARRSANADEAFGQVRSDTIPLAPESVMSLRTDYGRSAITEAAKRERDPEIRAALNRLAGDALDNPGQTEITIGMADRISRVLKGQAGTKFREGDPELGGLLLDLGENIRNPARQASPGYATALEGYGADSRLIQAAEVGEDFLQRNTDEFVTQASGLADEERQLALAAARRAIERKVGESPSAAPRFARDFANASEQQQRSAALMGEGRAKSLEDALRLEEQSLRNAFDVYPRGGAQTQLRSAEAEKLAGAVDGAMKVGRGFMGDKRAWIDLGLDWLRTRGLNDADAQRMVEMSISRDPENIDRAIQYMMQQGAAKSVPRLRVQTPALLSASSNPQIAPSR